MGGGGGGVNVVVQITNIRMDLYSKSRKKLSSECIQFLKYYLFNPLSSLYNLKK